jgi:hypothetical protein
MSEETNNSGSAPGIEVIERILEFSAEAQIERRKTVPGSPAFRHLTRVMAAYGEILSTISILQHQEERYVNIIRQGCRRNEPEKALTRPNIACVGGLS